MRGLLRLVVHGGHITRRPSDPGPYTLLFADLMRDEERVHHVELTASPTGKNLHVYVDGVRYVREDDRG